MSARRWQPEGGRAAVERAVASAVSVTAAAEELGCDRQTFRRWCRQADPPVDLAALSSRGSLANANARRLAAGVAEPLDPAEQLERDKELARTRAQRDHFKRQYEAAVKEQRSVDDITVSLAERYADPLPAPTVRAVRRPRGKKLPKREAILQVSDWQLGQLVRDTDTGGVNEYNWAVAESRMQRWLEAAVLQIENHRQAYDVWRIVVAISGDIVEGHDIYSGQAWSLDKDAAQQAWEGGALLASALHRLMAELAPATFDIYCVPGNHGKPGGRAAGATPTTYSFDHLLYQILKLRLQNAPVNEWGIEPCGRLLFMCSGVPFLMTHGDEVRGWGGFPYYGLDKAQGRLLQELDTIFHVWLLSHWHQNAALPSGRGMRIVNGNAVGPNRLTTAAVLGGNAPAQNLIYVSRDFGVGEIAFLHLAPNEIRAPRIYGGHAA